MTYMTTDLLVRRTHSPSVEAPSMSSESLFSYAAGWLSFEGAGEVGSLHHTRALVSPTFYIVRI